MKESYLVVVAYRSGISRPFPVSLSTPIAKPREPGEEGMTSALKETKEVHIVGLLRVFLNIWELWVVESKLPSISMLSNATFYSLEEGHYLGVQISFSH